MTDPMDRRCTATSKQSGERCRRLPTPGGEVCSMHGGAALQVRRAAAARLERQAFEAETEAEWTRLVREDVPDVDPTQVLLRQVAWASACVSLLRHRMRDLDSGALDWGITSEKTTADGVETTRTARQPVLFALVSEWTTKAADLAALALRMGIERGQLELAQQMGGVLIQVVQQVLFDAELDDAADTRVRAAFARHLTAIGTTTAIGSAAS